MRKDIYRVLMKAAKEVDSKLQDRKDSYSALLSNLKPDYSGSDLSEPTDLPADYYASSILVKIPNVLAYLEVYAYIIANAMPSKDLEDISMLDFGGGAGFMSLLAKQAGIGSVVYHDRDPGAHARAQVIGEALSLQADQYLCGTEDILREHPARFDSIVSSDVLEHVYDPRNVIKCWAAASAPGAKMFHQTGANSRNLHQRWWLSKLQRESEQRYILKSRQDLIGGYAQTLSQEEIGLLAQKTRGLDANDIKTAVDNYLVSQKIPEPEHPTNTCEINGYWIERFMEPQDVADLCNENGFDAEVRGSRWGIGKSRFLPATIKRACNLLALTSIWISLRVTFYYCIAAEKKLAD